MQLGLLQIAALGGGKLLRVPLAIALMSVLANVLGPAGIGRWAMVMAAATLFHGLLLSWLQAAHVRYGREEWTSRGSLAGTWAARWPLIALGLAISILALAAGPFGFLERLFGLPQDLWPLVALILLGQWFSAEAQSLYRLMGKVAGLALVPAAIDLAMIVIAALMLLAPGEQRTNSTILLLAIALTLGWGCAWGMVFSASGAVTGARPTLPALRQTIRYSWALVPGFLFAYLSNWGDHVVLQYFRTVEEVGLFDAGYQVMTALQGFAAPFAILLLPRLIDRKRSNEDRAAEVEYATTMLPTLLALWLAVAMAGLAFVPWLFALVFGPAFKPAEAVMLVLCGTIPGAAMTALYAILFEAQGRLGRSAALAAAMVSVNLAISIMLVPALGGLGAAIGTLCANLVIQALYLRDQHVFLGIGAGKNSALLLFSTVYAGLQILAGTELPVRLLLAAGGIVALGFIARRFQLLHEDALTELLPARWRPAVLPYLRPLCAPRG